MQVFPICQARCPPTSLKVADFACGRHPPRHQFCSDFPCARGGTPPADSRGGSWQTLLADALVAALPPKPPLRGEGAEELDSNGIGALTLEDLLGDETTPGLLRKGNPDMADPDLETLYRTINKASNSINLG